ncbi:MAG: hypothetical protein QMD85_00030 [Candidatus Aenigmarchaeota archaeon]|nr:hypothetical protein [Candidatus Aenigmarchaeota archaeon]MDI6721916.1 hypothetical protein [Candidatus Aenigmarchaeota archaeon]
MAKKRSSRRTSRKRRHPYAPSVINKKELFLNKHDEEKVLLFAAGILFGAGLFSSLVNLLWFTGISLLVIAIVLLFVEQRQI